MRINRRDHISSNLDSHKCLPLKSRINIELLFTYKALKGVVLSCLEELIVLYYPNFRNLWFQVLREYNGSQGLQVSGSSLVEPALSTCPGCITHF